MASAPFGAKTVLEKVCPLCQNGHGRTLLVLLNVLGGRCANADHLDELMDDGIRDFGLARMQPGESVDGHSGGQKVSGTVRHIDEVGGMHGTGKLGDTWL